MSNRVNLKMTVCSLELKFVLCYNEGNYYLQFKMRRLLVETKLLIILFKLAQLVQFELASI